MIPKPKDINWSSTRSDKVIDLVTEKLRASNIHYTVERGMRIVEFIVPGHLNDYEKSVVIQAMSDSEWENVSVRNSGDGEERAGLVCVRMETGA